MTKALFGTLLVLAMPILTSGQEVDRTLDLKFENAPLHELIDYLDQSSDYSFSFSSSAIPMNTLVSVNQENISIWQALDYSLEYMPVSYEVLDKNIILKYHERTQIIRGTVTDSDSRQPIFGATVVVVDSNPTKGAVSDENGKFRIENVPVGRVTLRVNYVGYEARMIPNILLGTGKEMVLNLEITESVINMDEVLVEAVGMGSQPLNEMALVSGRSFTVEETKRFQVGVGDPLRMASSFAGVMGTDDIGNEIIIRGNTPRGILWRMEGIEMPSPNHFSSEGAANGGISMLSTQMLSRSDFYTGAFAAQYGNALSGVFDLQLRKGNSEKDEKTLQLGLLGLDVSMEGPLGKNDGSYLFNYRYSTLSMLSSLGLVDIGGDYVFQDLSFNFSLPTKSLGTFSLFGLGGKSKYAEKGFGWDDNEEYGLGVIGLRNQLSINDRTYLESSLSWSGTQIVDDYHERNYVDEVTSFDKNYMRYSLLANMKVSARHTVESGAILSRIDFDFSETVQGTDQNGQRQPVEILFDDDDYTWTQQAYSTWKYRVSDKFTWVNGVHLFHFNMNDEFTIEPRSSLKWNFVAGQSFSLGFGKHSRMESLEYYLGNGLDLLGNSVDHNRGLKVTKSNHYVMGYDRAITPSLYFKMELYYQYLYDIPILRDVESTSFSTINQSDGYVSNPLVNEGTGRNYGVEMTLDKKFHNQYYFLANGSVFSSKYTSSDGIERDTRFAGNYTVHALGGKEWSVGKGHRDNIFGISAKFSASGNQRYSVLIFTDTANGPVAETDPNDIFKHNLPTYMRADLQISFRKNKKLYTSEWRLDIQNITNRENVIGHNYVYTYPNPLASTIVRYNETQFGLLPILSYRIEF